MINNQPSLSYERGTYGALGCLAKNAAGAIAIYNICQLDRFELSLQEIIDMIKKGYGLRLWGACGTKISAIKRTLEQLEFEVHFQGWFQDVKQIAQHNYFYILYRTDNWEWHCQAGYFLDHQRFTLFNPNHIYDGVQQFREFEEVAGHIWLFTVD